MGLDLQAGQASPDGMEALLRVQEAFGGCRAALGHILKKEPWRTLTCETWKFGLGSCTVLPKIQHALRVCASDPAAWVKTAALIPTWKAEVRPGTTTELEEMLWKVLLVAWDNFDAEDQPASAALLNRLHLARRLMAPNRPDADCIDCMERVAPRP